MGKTADKRLPERPHPSTEARYAEALRLYGTSSMSVREICRLTGTPSGGFRAYVGRYHRDLMFARHGIEMTADAAASSRLRDNSGQTAASRARYKDAIEACDSVDYLEYNVSEIARIFNVSPVSLGNQLRSHYPDILVRRENERRRLGMADNRHRGVRPVSEEQYAGAVEHLRVTDDTIRETAALYNISYPGLREHIIYYHKDLVRNRAGRRSRARDNKTIGGLTANGSRHLPSPRDEELYREAISLRRTTAMTQAEIARKAGVSLRGLRNHIRIWHRELISTDRYRKSTAAKYADAILSLKTAGKSVAGVAGEFGLNADTFRAYIRQHEPQFASSLGMKRKDDGRLVSARSEQKYREAISIYETTSEPLKSIALRLGLTYNSLGGYIRRNRPDAIRMHERVLADEKDRAGSRRQTASAEESRRKKREERDRIILALRQTSNNRAKAARLLGISKTTLYNRIKLLSILEVGIY